MEMAQPLHSKSVTPHEAAENLAFRQRRLNARMAGVVCADWDGDEWSPGTPSNPRNRAGEPKEAKQKDLRCSGTGELWSPGSPRNPRNRAGEAKEAK